MKIDTQNTSPPDTRGTVQPDTRSPDTQAQPLPDTRPPADTRVEFPYCPQAQGLAYSACGLLLADQSWVSKWKDGYACGVCTTMPGGGGTQHTSCLIAKSPAAGTPEGPGPVLCVQGCTECCWARAGSVCQRDADCCAPLRCSAGTCQ